MTIKIINNKAKNHDPSICPCGNKYRECKNPACRQEMIDAEDAAYCPHGYLAGCPICTKK